METRTLQYVVDACQGELIHGSPSGEVSHVCTDSRAVKPGDLFVALKGDQFDGHEFVRDVIAKGAMGAVVHTDAGQGDPSRTLVRVKDTRRALGRLAARYRHDFQLPMIAVAGSNGKTSTKELLASVLRQKFPVLWSEASFNNDVGVPLTLLRLESTHRAAVLEIGTNHPGELAPLIRLVDPQIGVLTSIGREHLEFFGDLDGVIEEEGVLAELLPADGVLFLNGDSEGAEKISGRCSARIVRAGLGQGNEWRAENIRFRGGRYEFDLISPEAAMSGSAAIRMLGRAQVGNALLAAAVGAHLGLTREQILAGLAECRPARMRMEFSEFGGVQLLNDAYNANADSTRVALETMAELPVRGRRIVVLGDMAELGQHAHAAHFEIGGLAARLKVDHLLAIGEQAGTTVEAARADGLVSARVCDSLESLETALRELLRDGDLLLLKASRRARLDLLAGKLKAHFGS